jgi:hypothetical protein
MKSSYISELDIAHYQIRRYAACHWWSPNCVLEDQGPTNQPGNTDHICHQGNREQNVSEKPQFFRNNRCRFRVHQITRNQWNFTLCSCTSLQCKCRSSDRHSLLKGSGMRAQHSTMLKEQRRCRLSEMRHSGLVLCVHEQRFQPGRRCRHPSSSQHLEWSVNVTCETWKFGSCCTTWNGK